MRKPSSLRVYHDERKNRQPGKYAASTTPRMRLGRSQQESPERERSRYRHTTRPAKFWHAAVAVEMMPQTTMQAGRYIAGLPILSRNMLLGTDGVSTVDEGFPRCIYSASRCIPQTESTRLSIQIVSTAGDDSNVWLTWNSVSDRFKSFSNPASLAAPVSANIITYFGAH